MEIEALYIEVCSLAEEQGAQTQEMWNDLVDEVVQAHIDLGEISSDQNIDETEKILKLKFEEYLEELNDKVHGLDEELFGVEEDNRG